MQSGEQHPEPATKKRLLITRRLPIAVEQRAMRDYEVTLNEDDSAWTAGNLLKACAGQDAVLCCLTEKFNADLIKALPQSVKILSSFSVGMDHVDLKAARARGLKVGNAPNGVTISTAEIALMLMLAAAHRAEEGRQLIAGKAWEGWAPRQLLGRRMLAKRLGILGLGKIGQAVAVRARAFGMEVHYHNRRPVAHTDLPPELVGKVIYHDNLENLLKASDILSLHAPATAQTRHIINAETLRLLPENAILINTARGDLVRDEDLIAALKSGKLFAAGLDVFENEPHLNAGYYGLDNAFILPHMGSSTIEAREEMGFEALDNIDAFFSGAPLPFEVV